MRGGVVKNEWLNDRKACGVRFHLLFAGECRRYFAQEVSGVLFVQSGVEALCHKVCWVVCTANKLGNSLSACLRLSKQMLDNVHLSAVGPGSWVVYHPECAVAIRVHNHRCVLGDDSNGL